MRREWRWLTSVLQGRSEHAWFTLGACVHELQLFNTTRRARARAQSRVHELVHAHHGRPFQVSLELEPSRGNRNL